MLEFSKEQFLNAYSASSDRVKDIALGEETQGTLEKIAIRHNAQSKLFKISATVGYILVGLVPIKRFIQTLKEEAELSEEVAKNVAHDVRSEILAPVAKELAAIQEEAEAQWEQAHSDKPKTPNPKPEIKNSNQEQPGPGLPAKDESVAREVFPAPEVKEDKFEQGPEGEMPKEKKDNRF